MSLYVYAISRAEDGETPLLDGILEQPVYQVQRGSLAAIVSDCQLEVMRPERRHLSANQKVLSAFNARRDILPMAFGTVAESEESLGQFLDEHQDGLTTQLANISGAVEMALKLSLDVADPIAYLVEHTPELEAARRRAFRRGREPSYDEKLRLGQLCDESMRRYREALTARVLAIVRPSCKDVMVLPVHEEREVAHLAVLAPRAGLDEFQAAVEASADQFDDDLAFSIHGPWPPHTFASVRPVMNGRAGGR